MFINVKMNTTDTLLTFILVTLGGGVSIIGFNAINYYFKQKNDAKYMKIILDTVIKFFEIQMNRKESLSTPYNPTKNSNIDEFQKLMANTLKNINPKEEIV